MRKITALLFLMLLILILPLTTYAADTKSPTAPSGLKTVVPAAYNRVELTWTASTDNVGVGGYDIYRNSGKIATTTGATFIDTTVSPLRSYSYYVVAFDAAGNRSPASNTLFVSTPAMPDITPPTAPTNLLASAITTNSATLTWTASTDNMGVSGYEVYKNGTKLTTTKLLKVTDPSLSAGTTYSFYVIAIDAAGNKSAQSNTVTITTIGNQDTTPPSAPTGLLSMVDLSLQPPLIDLIWEPSTDDVGVTGYRIYRSTDDGATYTSIATTNFTNYTDSDIQLGTSYTYFVAAYDAANNLSGPSNYVSESISADTEPPSAPNGLVGTAASATKVDLTWNASTDNVGVGWYELYRSTDGVQYTLVDMPTQTNYTDNTVLENSTYNYYVIALDDQANASTESNIITVTTPAAADTQAPTVPTGLQATSISFSLVNLAWTPSSDNIGVTGYNVYRDGVLAGTTAGTNYADSNVTGPMTYIYTVSAVDAAGNESAQSTSLTVNTPTPPDTTAPTAPTNLTATATSANQVALNWTAATDNVGVTGYEVYRNNIKVATGTTLDYADSNLAQGVLYTYYVIALDAANNKSQPSNYATVSIPDTQAPTIPGNVTAIPVSATQVDVSWTASTDNVAVTGYEVYRNNTKLATTITASFSDTSTAPSTFYTYYVLALDAAGNKSSLSNEVTVTTPANQDTNPPSAPTGLSTVGTPTYNQVELTWTAATDDVGVTGYDIYRNGAKIAATTETTFIDETVLPLRSYQYYVVAVDAAGNKSAQSNTVTVTTLGNQDTTPPSAPTGLVTMVDLSIQPPMIDLVWEPSTDNIGVTGYRIYRSTDDGATFASIAATTFTNYTDSDIQLGTIYTYYVAAYDAANNLSEPSNYVTESISGDTEPPSAPSGLAASAVTAAQVELTWNASTDNVGVGWYELYRSEDGVEYNQVDLPTETYYMDTTVLENATYYYYVIAVDDAANASAASNIITVTTPSAADTQAPTVPTGLQATSISSSLVDIVWTASSDNVGVTGYNVYRDNVLVGTTVEPNYADSSVSGTMTYIYTVSAVDAAGNESAQCPSVTVNTPTPSDTQSPTAPDALTGVALQSNQVQLNWNASVDNIGVSGYEVYRNWVKIGTSTTNSYTDTGTVANGYYRYHVIAYDAAGNLSVTSNNIVIVPPDTLSPTAPASFQAIVMSATQVDMSWSAATDNVGVAGYEIYRNNTKLATTALTSYSDTTAAPSNIYTYYVLAIDAVGNKSPLSNEVTVTTPAYQDTTPPSAPSELNAIVQAATEVSLTWTISTDNVGVAGYLVYRDNIQIADVATNQYTDVALSDGTLYQYYVQAYDEAGNISDSSYTINVETPSVDSTPPDAPTNLQTTAVYYNGVDLIWTAALDDVGVTGYDIYRNEVLVGNVTKTSFSDAAVTPLTNYSYYVVARDLAGNESNPSNTIAVTTPAMSDTQAPSVPANFSETAVTYDSVSISWQSSTDNVGVTGYEVVRSSFLDGELILSTSQTTYTDRNVLPRTQYTYKVRAFDAAGNRSAETSSLTITTPDTPDTMAPQPPTLLAAKAVSSSQIDLTWRAAADNVGVTGYELYRDGAIIATTSNLKYSDTGLTTGIKYTYYIIAFDAAGNKSLPSASASATPSVDTQVPSTPTGLNAVKYTSTYVELAWKASTDNIGVTGYKVYRNGHELAISDINSYTDTTVLPGYSYSYYVVAFDAVGNLSKASTSISVFVPQAVDYIAPSAPTNLRVVNAMYNQVDLFWNSSTDNLGVKGYMIYRDGVYVGTSTLSKYSDKTVATKTTYTYYIIAYDAAGNKSAASNQVTVTTPAGGDSIPPTAPADMAATATAYNRVELSWTPSTDNLGVSGYLVYRNNVFVATLTGSSYADTKALASTTYTYYVIAFDASRNKSVPSSTVTVTTPAI